MIMAKSSEARSSDDFPFDLRGFIYDNGVLNEIHVPGSLNTSPSGINNRGQIIGTVRFFNDPVSKGFLFERGEFQIFDGFVRLESMTAVSCWFQSAEHQQVISCMRTASSRR